MSNLATINMTDAQALGKPITHGPSLFLKSQLGLRAPDTWGALVVSLDPFPKEKQLIQAWSLPRLSLRAVLALQKKAAAMCRRAPKPTLT